MTESIQTVTGAIAADALGETLMHEHLLVANPGWESDTRRPPQTEAERVSLCVERIEEMKADGYRSMLDPCPSDLGRDVELMAKVAQKTGFQLICAAGLYKEESGGKSYWEFAGRFTDVESAMADMFIQELMEGIGSTGIRAGIIKVATGPKRFTDYEKTIFRAAARAAVATGAPITTHTDQGTMGDAQQQLLTEAGVPAHRIVIGHSCGTSDPAYHLKIARAGSYLGFDRFGLDAIHPDEERVASLSRLISAGAGDRVVVSHDSVWCWGGSPLPPGATLGEHWNPLHFKRRIVPRLREAGVADEQIERLLVDNPRSFFAGEKLSALA